MASPTPYDRPSHRDLRLTPTPAEDYRCPVSTPANYMHRHSRIRRSKPMIELSYSQTPSANGRQPRSKGMALTRHSRNVRASATLKVPLPVGNSLKYYFVDQGNDQKEAEHTNTHWLKALCSQPVDEILNKYRRKSDVKRTRVIWGKTFSTPGEKSLLSAWENNMFQSMGRERNIKSEYLRATRSTDSTKRPSRLTQSEPPLSRAHNLDLHSGTVSPVSMNKEARTAMEIEMVRPESLTEPSLKEGSPRKRVVKEFLGEDPSARISSYVTQYYAPKGNGPMYAKVIKSPDLLPNLSSQRKIASMGKERYSASLSSSTPRQMPNGSPRVVFTVEEDQPAPHS